MCSSFVVLVFKSRFLGFGDADAYVFSVLKVFGGVGLYGCGFAGVSGAALEGTALARVFFGGSGEIVSFRRGCVSFVGWRRFFACLICFNFFFLWGDNG